MQLSDVLCYIVLTITVTTTCATAEQQNKEVEESQDAKKISKREATVLVDFNYNQMDKIFQRPKVIYRRISKSRYGPPKTKYGGLKPKHETSRPKTKPHKMTRKPGKKGRIGKPKSSSHSHKYKPNKKRAPTVKPKYGVPQFRPNSRPGLGHVVKMPHYSFFSPYRASGFGEPPEEFMFDHQLHKNAYVEPPVDSYGAPLKPSLKDVFPTPHTSQEPFHQYDAQDYKKQEKPWKLKHSQNSDTTYDFTQKEPTFSNFVTPTPKDIHIESLDPIEDKQKMQDNKYFYRKKRPYYFTDAKVVNLNRPWKSNKPSNDFDDEIVVGGQYAEPPARYVAKPNHNSPGYEEDEEEGSFPGFNGYTDSDVALSAHNSPYSNYRHSNMAFSPQNLNDVFSVVNK